MSWQSPGRTKKKPPEGGFFISARGITSKPVPGRQPGLRRRWQVPGQPQVRLQGQEPQQARVQVQEQALLRGPGPGQLLPSCRRQTEPRQQPGKPTGAMFSFIPLREIFG